MIKKLLLLIVLIIFSVGAYAEDVIKINSINFDNSDAIIFLGTSKQIKGEKIEIISKKMSEPDRIYFDINNSVLTQPKSTWEFKNSHIKKLKISQFSTNPYVTRIVFYPSDNYKTANIKAYSLDDNIFFKLENNVATRSNIINLYREQRTSNSDFTERTRYFEEIVKAPTPSDNKTAQNINKAFSVNEIDEEPVREYKLKTGSYINQVFTQNGNVLIAGMGIIQAEKPIILKEPNRLVIDLPNSVLAQNLKNKEFLIGDSEYLRIAQFEANKVRIVIKSPYPEKYRPIYSNSLQGILISNDSKINGVKLFNQTANLKSLKFVKMTDEESNIEFNFDKSVIHSVKRNNNNLEFIIYNACGYYENEIRKMFSASKLSNTKVVKIGSGLKFIIPLMTASIVDTYVTNDGKQIRLVIKNYKPETKIVASKVKGEVIVIDPGHGGVDVGATRDGVYEKDINLEISQMVASILKKKGAKVELTRDVDKTLSLQERVDISEDLDAKIFVSIHVNSSVKPEIYGIETHYYKENSYELAKITQNFLAKSINSTDRGIFQSKFYVINHTTAPSILVETGFISNDNERNALLTHDRKEKIAKAIADGIMTYLAQQGK